MSSENTKLVVVTGASSGIGHALVGELAARGHSILAVARRAEILHELARAWPNCTPHPLDLRTADVAALAERAHRVAEGREVVLVNGAGSAQFAAPEVLTPSEVADMVALNLTIPLNLIAAFVPGMESVQKGHIINILSIAAHRAFGSTMVYGATKAGLRHATKCLAESVRKRGIRVTGISPGAVDTDIWPAESWVPERNRMLTPVAVAEVIADIIDSPPGRSFDEVVLMPPEGVL